MISEKTAQQMRSERQSAVRSFTYTFDDLREFTVKNGSRKFNYIRTDGFLFSFQSKMDQVELAGEFEVVLMSIVKTKFFF